MKRVAVLSNINIDNALMELRSRFELYQPSGYGVWVQEIMNENSGLYTFAPEAVFIIVDGDELLKSCETLDNVRLEIDRTAGFLRHAAEKHNEVAFFLSTVDLPQKKIRTVKNSLFERVAEGAWSDMVAELSLMLSNVYPFDLKRSVEQIGRERFYSDKFWYLGGMKFTMEASALIEKEISRMTDALSGCRKKCLVLDLDNTLWGGVIGEDGIDGVLLSDSKEGARYKDFQRRIKELKKTGTILAVNSKNNPDDALEMIRKHSDMVLKEDDFVNFKVNWQPKVENMKEIAEELNIGIDSLVFIDDNPAERESVKEILPQVTVPDFPKDTSRLSSMMTELYRDLFLSLKATGEDLEKTEMYRQNTMRKDLMKSSASVDDFLKSLETSVQMRSIRSDDLSRAAQLSQKTNQFNVTTRRYSDSDISAMMADPSYYLFIASVKDRFGDNGIVALIIVKKSGKEEACIETFLMSCRVMERYVEDLIIDKVENIMESEGVLNLYANYIPTPKNKPVEKLFDRLGYSPLSVASDGAISYSIDLRTKPARKKFGEIFYEV